MSLSLQHHVVGDIAVIECNGRIVDGAETRALHQHLRDLLHVHHFLVIDLRGVSFVDSAGLGVLVQLLARVRAAAGDLKLCGAGPNVENALTITRLKTVFGSYATAADAIAAFHQAAAGSDLPIRAAVDIVCIHTSSDILAYVRELLRQAGYAVMTTNNVGEALTLIRATEPRVVVIESALHTAMAGAMLDIFQQFTTDIRVIDLSPGFATDDAGHAAAQLLAEVAG